MNNNQINDVKTEAFITLFSSIGTIIVGLVFSGFCFLFLLKVLIHLQEWLSFHF